MSDINVNQLLEQMRVASARINNFETEAAPAADRPNFGEVLGNAVNSVNKVQAEASELATALETGQGDADLVDVMLAIQTASVSFKTMSEVRNKLVDAYKEIMSMPV